MPVFIGDVHGFKTKYNHIIKTIGKPTFQIGDFGIGLGPWPGNEMYDLDAMRQGGHHFGRGNHDNPFLCTENPMFVPDGVMLEDFYWIGGAMSADRNNRIEGVDWWPEEELSIGQFSKIMDDYEQKKPDILVSHDCPEFLMEHIGSTINGKIGRAVGRERG